MAELQPATQSHVKMPRHQPRLPKRFSCIENARQLRRGFLAKYSQSHLPARQIILAAAFATRSGRSSSAACAAGENRGPSGPIRRKSTPGGQLHQRRFCRTLVPVQARCRGDGIPLASRKAVSPPIRIQLPQAFISDRNGNVLMCECPVYRALGLTRSNRRETHIHDARKMTVSLRKDGTSEQVCTALGRKSR
jgi:hypothetical protein